MAVWKPTDGYFGVLLAAILGRASRREPGIMESGGSGSEGAGQAINPDTALRLSAVWACVRLIAEAIGSMPINVYRKKGEVRKIDRNHWLNGLFNQPNKFQTRNEFFETVAINLMLAGNSYCRVPPRKNNGRIVSLMPMMATQTQVVLSRNNDRSYAYTEGTNVAVWAQDSVWHVPLMPSNSAVGLSPLQYGARTMGIAMAAESRVGTLAANGFKPTGVLMIDKTLKPEQRESIRIQFADLAVGQGDPLKVLEAGMKYQQISLAPKDVQLLETRRFSIEDIARFFGVPSLLINDTQGTSKWGTGISEIKEGFYTLSLQPLLRRLERSIERWLLPANERGIISVEFDFSAFLRGSEQQRIESMTKAISGKLLTMDEARERFDGLAPYPNGIGAVPYDQGQVTPMGPESSDASQQQLIQDVEQ